MSLIYLFNWLVNINRLQSAIRLDIGLVLVMTVIKRLEWFGLLSINQNCKTMLGVLMFLPLVMLIRLSEQVFWVWRRLQFPVSRVYKFGAFICFKAFGCWWRQSIQFEQDKLDGSRVKRDWTGCWVKCEKGERLSKITPFYEMDKEEELDYLTLLRLLKLDVVKGLNNKISEKWIT